MSVESDIKNVVLIWTLGMQYSSVPSADTHTHKTKQQNAVRPTTVIQLISHEFQLQETVDWSNDDAFSFFPTPYHVHTLFSHLTESTELSCSWEAISTI
jgi:hypothetical protein